MVSIQDLLQKENSWVHSRMAGKQAHLSVKDMIITVLLAA